MTTSCTELLEALRDKASPLPWTWNKTQYVHAPMHSKPEHSHVILAAPRGNRTPDEDACLAALAVNHLGPLMKALEYEHGAHWKEEPLPGHEDYVINSSCEEAECHVCKALAALRRDLEAALQVK